MRYIMMEITRISKEEDFFRLKDRWNVLLSESGLGNIFLTWEWLYNWWKVFKGDKDELFILLGIENSKISAIAPWYLNGGFHKKLYFLGSGVVCSEYLSFIVNEENRTYFLRALCDYLNNNNRQWDLLYLESLAPADKATLLLQECVNAKKWKWVILKEYTSSYLSLLLSLEEFKRTVSHSLIKKLLVGKRKLSSQGRVETKELICLNTEDLQANFNTVVSLHQKRWQELGVGISGVFSNKLMLRFLRAITEEFYKNNWLSIYCVMLDGKPIAADYNFKFNQKIWCYTGGFDPLYKQYSPGSICFWESMQFYINNGYVEYGFLRGDETYKNRWTDKYRKECDILVMAPGIKGFSFRIGNSFLTFAKMIFKGVVPSRVYIFFRALKFNRSR